MTAAAMPPAREGDLIKGAALAGSARNLLALAAALDDMAANNCSFPEQRRILRRKRSLISLAASLGDRDIALLPGGPQISAAQLDAAVVYASAAFAATSVPAEALGIADALLDLFVAVMGGDGAAMLAAARYLKRLPLADLAAAAGPATARPWEAAPYVLLPLRGMRAPEMAALQAVPDVAAGPSRPGATALQLALAEFAPPHGAPLRPSQLLHSIHADGAKLAELTPRDLQALKVSDPGVRALPLVLYQLSRRPVLELRHAFEPPAAAGATTLTLRIVRADKGIAGATATGDAGAGTSAGSAIGAAATTDVAASTGTGAAIGVAGARVIAFTDFDNRVGADGVSDVNGEVALALGGTSAALQVLVVYGPQGYWGAYRRDVTLASGATLALAAIDLAAGDYLSLLYGSLPPDAGSGVTVGVIDTGVDASHPDLVLGGGAAFVVDEDDAGGAGPAATDATDAAHGSHVAGIIASRGVAPAGKRGVAPAVRLMSYRVFPNAGGGASNYDIIRAIDRGVADGCDLLNLSLGGPLRDEAVREAIMAAYERGTVCVAAAGNDNRGPVNYPAHWPEAIAVTALGRRGTYPVDSSEEADALAPFAPLEALVFLAGFANVGAELDFAGPGVGIVSTVPGGGYAVMSGTSMACPAVTGAAAALLARHPAILAMPRDRRRAIAIVGLMNGAARTLGLAAGQQGLGWLP